MERISRGLRWVRKAPASWVRQGIAQLGVTVNSAHAILGLCVLALGLLIGCSPAPASLLPSPTTEAGPPSLEPQVTAVSIETTSEPPTSTPRPSPTPTVLPTPTPTPPPLPEVCLRQQFSDDIQACHAAPSYNIELTVDPASARVTGHEQITYTNGEGTPLDSLYLRLFPSTEAYGGAMTVTHLLKDGQPITPSIELEGSALRVPLEPPLRPDQMATLSMDFTVDVPTSGAHGHGLFSYIQGVMALPTVYPLIPVYDDHGWNAEIAPVHGDDVFSDVIIYHVAVTLQDPSDFTLVATGACGTPDNGTWTCEAAPMRDFTVILGEKYERSGRDVRGVVVNSYSYKQHTAGGARALDVAVDALEAFTDFFGPYPYTELDVVETPNYLGGMEYSGLAVVEDGLYPGVSTVEWLTAHEVAHQWWMVVVGNDQVNDPWLDEALTQYSTMLYYEAVYGKARANAILNTVFVQTHRALKSAGRDMPADLPADAYPSHLYFDTVYDKGALYFHELRERLGDEVFFDTLQPYYERHRFQIATPQSFLDTVEDVTGDRHLDLYEAWIGGTDEAS